MTVDEAIRYVESTWVSGAAPIILADEVRRLRKWKEEALAVESEWNAQAIARMLGAQLGDSCRVVIAKRVPEILAERDRYREALTEISKPWRHKYAVEYVLQGWKEIARDALRGGEE